MRTAEMNKLTVVCKCGQELAPMKITNPFTGVTRVCPARVPCLKCREEAEREEEARRIERRMAIEARRKDAPVRSDVRSEKWSWLNN